MEEALFRAGLGRRRTVPGEPRLGTQTLTVGWVHVLNNVRAGRGRRPSWATSTMAARARRWPGLGAHAVPRRRPGRGELGGAPPEHRVRPPVVADLGPGDRAPGPQHPGRIRGGEAVRHLRRRRAGARGAGRPGAVAAGGPCRHPAGPRARLPARLPARRSCCRSGRGRLPGDGQPVPRVPVRAGYVGAVGHGRGPGCCGQSRAFASRRRALLPCRGGPAPPRGVAGAHRVLRLAGLPRRGPAVGAPGAGRGGCAGGVVRHRLVRVPAAASVRRGGDPREPGRASLEPRTGAGDAGRDRAPDVSTGGRAGPARVCRRVRLLASQRTSGLPRVAQSGCCRMAGRRGGAGPGAVRHGRSAVSVARRWAGLRGRRRAGRRPRPGPRPPIRGHALPRVDHGSPPRRTGRGLCAATRLQRPRDRGLGPPG